MQLLKRFSPSDYTALFRLGLPVLVTQLGIIVVSFADTMMVGRYGTAELAAAAFVNSFFMVAFVMQIGFALGVTPLVGAAYGKGEYAEAGAILKSGLVANSLASILFMAVMGVLYFFLPYFGQPPELLPLIRPYYLIVLVSLFPSAIFNCCQQTANGSTDTSSPMWIILGGNLLNICGNWLLIYGVGPFPELGLVGAGYSTLLARTIMMVAILLIFFHTRKYRSIIEGFRQKIRGSGRMRRIVMISYPVMVQSGVECSLWTVGAVACGSFGAIQLASYQVINTIGQLGFMIYMSFSTATSIRVSNFTGVGDWRKVASTTRAGLHICLVLGTMSSLIFLLLGKPLVALFTTDPEVIAGAMPLILPLVLYQYGDATQLTFANALRGMSDTTPLLKASLISYVAIGVPVLYLLAFTFGLENVGVYYSFSFALFAASFLLYRAYSRHHLVG